MSQSSDTSYRSAEIFSASNTQGAASQSPSNPVPTSPGDEAPPGTVGTGENVCRECGGSGLTRKGETCPQCQGTGKVNVGIGGA